MTEHKWEHSTEIDKSTLKLEKEKEEENNLPDDVKAALDMIRQMEVSQKENSSTEEYKNSLLSSELLSKSTFEDLKIPENIIKALRSMDFKNPSTIQQKAIPEIATGRDVAFQSHSGSGKTIAFLVGALAALDESVAEPQVIIATPTRDLSRQIYAVLEKFRETVKFTVLQALPDTMEERKDSRIEEQIVVGSPGTIRRVLGNIENPGKIKMVVLDEADALLEGDMGSQTVFFVNKIKKKQLVLFSATFSAKMKEAISLLSKDIRTWYLEEKKIKPDNITQFYMEVPEKEKKKTLRALYEMIPVGQSIIFVHTRDKAEEVQEDLKKDGFDSEVLHGQLDKPKRDSVINEFKSGEIKALVTTNVLSRGLDVPQLNLAVNYDVPRKQTGEPDAETYVHRIGRTGRFNRAGVSITFISGSRDTNDLMKIQREMESEIKYITLDALKTAIREKQKIEDRDSR